MNKEQLKYNFPRLLVLIGVTEFVFGLLFFAAHALIAIVKSEPIISSFLVYQQAAAFWLLLALVPLYLLYLGNLSWKNKVLNRTFSPRLQQILLNIPGLRISFWRFFILRSALVFIILALANPQAGKREIDVDGYAGEFVVVVDISQSMLVRDMTQGRSRLDAAKNGLNNISKTLKGSGMGIVVFAGSAFSYMPMTKDVRVMQSYINSLSTESISEQGTHIAEAINTALRSFSKNTGTKLIFLLSDGEDHEGGLDEAVVKAKEENAIIHVLALGSPNGGPIPEKKGGVKKDAAGEMIISKPNFELLMAIAEATNGRFKAETKAFPSLGSWVQAELKEHLSTMKIESTMKKSFGGIFALHAFILLLLYLVLTHLNIKPKTDA